MHPPFTRGSRCIGFLFLPFLLLAPSKAVGHCDGLDGPVVEAARQALMTGELYPLLIWVRDQDEPEIRKEFQRVLQVRTKGKDVQELADRYFFETVVRLHRTAEGAPYTGLKPSGRDLGPAIPAADQALGSGSADNLAKVLSEEVARGTKKHFSQVKAKQKFAPTDVKSGREFVDAYVRYIHYVERIHEAAVDSVSGHYREAHEE